MHRFNSENCHGKLIWCKGPAKQLGQHYLWNKSFFTKNETELQNKLTCIQTDDIRHCTLLWGNALKKTHPFNVWQRHLYYQRLHKAIGAAQACNLKDDILCVDAVLCNKWLTYAWLPCSHFAILAVCITVCNIGTWSCKILCIPSKKMYSSVLYATDIQYNSLTVIQSLGLTLISIQSWVEP